MTHLTVLLLTAAAGFAAATGRPPEGGRALDAAAAFARLAALEGTWEAEGASGPKATVTFELVSNGTVLVEHYRNPALPGAGHMMTAFHLDGETLLLTHYCIANNQPTLRAERFDPATGELQFEFLRATGLRTQRAGHMRRARYRLEGPDAITSEWEFFENGSRKMTEVERFRRVARS